MSKSKAPGNRALPVSLRRNKSEPITSAMESIRCKLNSPEWVLQTGPVFSSVPLFEWVNGNMNNETEGGSKRSV